MPNLFFVSLKVMPNLSVIDLWIQDPNRTYIRRLIYVQFRSAQGVTILQKVNQLLISHCGLMQNLSLTSENPNINSLMHNVQKWSDTL